MAMAFTRHTLITILAATVMAHRDRYSCGYGHYLDVSVSIVHNAGAKIRHRQQRRQKAAQTAQLAHAESSDRYRQSEQST